MKKILTYIKPIQRFIARLWIVFDRIWRLLGGNDFVRMIYAGLIIAFIVSSAVGYTIWTLSQDLPDLDQLKDYEPRLTTRIHDRNGELLTELFTQKRLITPLNRVPQHTLDALLATEDRRFFDHWGVDMIRVIGATVINISTLSIREGASTITQQLARDLYLHKRRTFTRKIREILTALQIERNYSKQEILEMYLTQIYFGHGAYGIGSAADLYFNKKPEELDIEESALLAALPKAPGRYSPYFHPERARWRRNIVLRGMLSQGFITAEEFNAAREKPLQLAERNSQTYNYGDAPYFTEMIRQELSSEGKRYGFDYLEDGLIVQTTLDKRIQDFAETAIDSFMTEFQSEYRKRFIEREKDRITLALYDSSAFNKQGKSKIPLDTLIADSVKIDSLFPAKSIAQVALIALDPLSGDILAMIGGRDFNKSKFNRATQAVRQPGSIFKPFAYIAAIDNGYPPTFELLNQDVVIINPDGSRWVPQNYDLSHGGPTTLREALRMSLNLVSVRLVQDVVPPSLVKKYARQLGISTPIAAVDAIVLGASGVYPIEITSAFAALGNGGILCNPRGMTEIKDRFGETIAEYSVAKRVALSGATAYIITDMLKTVINRGTGGSARWKYKFYQNAAGKTGTTNDYTDAWFIGFTPKIACGVWVGLDDPSQSLGPGQSGSRAALPIWATFMKSVYDSLEWEDESFEIPSGVVWREICDDTKDLATPYCPTKVKEIFREDAQPMQKCKKHRKLGGL